MNYEQIDDGEWEEIPMTDFRIGCCDCGLVHDIEFRVKGKKLERRVFRNDYETTKLRETVFKGLKLPQ